MKKVVIAALIAATIIPAKAQIFSRESLGGAVLGGIAGGIIGHNSGGRTAEGIGIGAGAGLLLGALTSKHRRNYYEGPYSHDYYEAHYGYAPYYSRPNYAVTGALLGGVAGGIIGHNQGRHTAEGIAIGAGAGLLMGGIAEHEMRKRERLSPYYVPQTVVISRPATVLTTTPVVTQAVAQEQEQPQQVTYNLNSGGGSPMSSANALFGR